MLRKKIKASIIRGKNSCHALRACSVLRPLTGTSQMLFNLQNHSEVHRMIRFTDEDPEARG